MDEVVYSTQYQNTIDRPHLGSNRLWCAITASIIAANWKRIDGLHKPNVKDNQ